MAISEQHTGRMNIVFHLGVHCTDGGLLIRSVLQNRARLSEVGVSVPGPLRYRELIGEASTKLRGEPASADTEALILDAILDDPNSERIVLSSENFLCRSSAAIGPDCLYPKAHKSAWLRQCFPSHQVEFALALRNPAGFLPDLMTGKAGASPDEDVLKDGIWLPDLRWSDVVKRISDANPGCRILVWCHEDTPFIWSEILHELSGLDPIQPLEGSLDMVETIITSDGYARLTDFLEAREVSTETRRRRAISAFLEAHAEDDKIESEIDLQGWTDETVDRLTDLYEDDVAEITRTAGVTFISP